MTRGEAIKILDGVIPSPNHATVDLDHLPITQAWVVIKNELKQKRKEGKWKMNKDGNWACPFCEFDPYHDNMKGMNYCPNCGARMEVEK